MRGHLFLVFLLVGSVCVHGQTLDEYVRMALEQNTGILISITEEEAAAQAVDTLSISGNTSLQVGYLGLFSSTASPVGYWGLKVGQQWSWPGVVQARRAVGRSKADEYGVRRQLERLRIALQVKQLYYRLYGWAALMQVYKENKEIIATYEETATRALANNHATLSDVLLIQAKKNELHTKFYQAFNTQKALRRTFNRLLDRPPETEVFIPDSLSILDVMLPSRGPAGHPLLHWQEAAERTVDEEQNLLEIRAHRPDLNAAIQWGWSPTSFTFFEPAPSFYVFPRIGLSFPLFGKAYQSKRALLQLDKNRIQQEKYRQSQWLDDETDKERAALENAITSVVAAQKNASILQRAIDAKLIDIEHLSVNYTSLLQLQLDWMKYRIMEIEGIRDTYLHKARLDYLKGKI